MESDDDLPPDLVEVRPIDSTDPTPTHDRVPNEKPPRMIPITLLTGYLGSGKTTLLQYILNENHGYRIAVCMNDFSDTTDIEKTSLSLSNPSTFPPLPTSTSQTRTETDTEAETETEQTKLDAHQTRFLSLPNGCLCCSIKEPGIAAIENMVAELELEEEQEQEEEEEESNFLESSPILAKDDEAPDANSASTPPVPPTSSNSNTKPKPKIKSRRKPRPIDWLLIELTGIADPTEIAKTFWQNEEMGGRLRLDGIVGVVDCRNVDEQLRERSTPEGVNECQKQIAASDVILLNKTDLVTEQQVEYVQATIQHINPTAIFKKTTRSRVPLEEIFRLGSYSTNDADARPEGDDRNLQVLRDASVSTGLRAREREDVKKVEHDNDNDHDHASHGSPHLSDISSVVIDLPVLSQVKYETVERFLQAVHWDSRPPGSVASSETGEFQVLRSKGAIHLEDGSTFVLQGVRDLFEIKPLSRRQNGGGADGSKGKLVFIGKGLPPAQVWRNAIDV